MNRSRAVSSRSSAASSLSITQRPDRSPAYEILPNDPRAKAVQRADWRMIDQRELANQMRVGRLARQPLSQRCFDARLISSAAASVNVTTSSCPTLHFGWHRKSNTRTAAPARKSSPTGRGRYEQAFPARVIAADCCGVGASCRYSSPCSRQVAGATHPASCLDISIAVDRRIKRHTLRYLHDEHGVISPADTAGSKRRRP